MVAKREEAKVENDGNSLADVLRRHFDNAYQSQKRADLRKVKTNEKVDINIVSWNCRTLAGSDGKIKIQTLLEQLDRSQPADLLMLQETHMNQKFEFGDKVVN
jgi:hypothetical protein